MIKCGVPQKGAPLIFVATDTTYRFDDTDNKILQKILLKLGGVPRPGDFDNTLYRKILEALGGVFSQGDNTNNLLRKIGDIVGASPRPGDTTNKLLYRICAVLGGVPRPGDYDNILLRKILVAGFAPPTPPLNPPAAPVATNATNPTGTSFSANWNISLLATNYRLDVSDSAVFAGFVPGYQDINVGNVTTFSVVGLTPNTTYYFRVRASNADGTSANSNVISIVTYDADLLDWVLRVQGQGSDVSTSTKNAVNIFITSVKAAGLRTTGSTKLKRVGVYAGNDILALNAPLYNEWGTATDTLRAFVGGDYAETGASGGLTGNTTTKSIDPGNINLGTVLLPNAYSYHQSVYIRDTTGGNVVPIGCQDPGSGSADYIYANLAGTSYFSCWGPARQVSAADAVGTGFYLGSRTSATSSNLYRNGVSIASTAVNESPTLPPGVDTILLIHGFNSGGGLGIAILNFPSPISFYSVGLGLTGAEDLALYNAVQALQTALSRNV